MSRIISVAIVGYKAEVTGSAREVTFRWLQHDDGAVSRVVAYADDEELEVGRYITCVTAEDTDNG